MDLPKIYEKRSTRWALALVTSALPLSSCQKQFVKERTTDNRAATLAAALGAGKSQNVIYTIDQATGRITATLSASALVTQEISASGAGLSGISVSFPPGSLAISTDINVQEAVTIATPNTAAALGISGAITGVGASVAIQPSVVADPVNAFTVALQIPSASSLRLAGNSANLVAIYKVNVYAKNKILDGVIPLSSLTVEGDKVKFSSRYFGAFQLAYTDTLVTAATEVETTVPVQSKVESGVLAPLNITARSPVVVRAGDTVTLSGNNFRPTMTLALGSKSVSKVNVASDVSASFVVPAELNGGVLPLLANQDGVSQTISLLYTPGTSSYPVITLPPAEVCSTQSYYDMNGALQTGSKNCAAPAVVTCAGDGATGCVATADYPAVDLTRLSPGVIKSGVTIAGIAGTAMVSSPCANDGQSECIVGGVFKAANVSGFSPWGLRFGTSIAGVAGALKVNCRNSTATTGGVGDTIDDYNGFAGTRVSNWPLGTFCDASSWEDKTTTDAGVNFSTCATASSDCQYKDKISNLVVTKTFTPASTWTGAMSACSSSNYGGFAAGTWRLPTQKELLSLYEHGIASKVSTDFISLTQMQAAIWSSSSTTGTSGSNPSAWAVVLANGKAEPTVQSYTLPFICVK